MRLTGRGATNLTREGRRINQSTISSDARYRRLVRIVGLALVLLTLVVPTAAATTTSGLRGIVTRGPTQPVCREGEPCEEPAANVTLLFVQSGRVVARTTTGPKGGYRVLLRPGRYAVTTARWTIGVGLTPRLVVVPRGRLARVDFDLDTGIR